MIWFLIWLDIVVNKFFLYPPKTTLRAYIDSSYIKQNNIPTDRRNTHESVTMGDTQHFCLRWNNYQSSITSAFENLRDDEDFVDVTLACDGNSLKAHRVVLSACSPYFRELLKVGSRILFNHCQFKSNKYINIFLFFYEKRNEFRCSKYKFIDDIFHFTYGQGKPFYHCIIP